MALTKQEQLELLKMLREPPLEAVRPDVLNPHDDPYSVYGYTLLPDVLSDTPPMLYERCGWTQKWIIKGESGLYVESTGSEADVAIAWNDLMLSLSAASETAEHKQAQTGSCLMRMCLN